MIVEIESVVNVSDGQTALILLSETGVKYVCQCGGTACSQMEEEGFVLNVGGLINDFNGCDYGCQYLSRDAQAQRRFADDVDMRLKQETDGWMWKVRFDYDRIDETKEGWIPVKTTGTYGYEKTPFEYKGFLHNGNCD